MTTADNASPPHTGPSRLSITDALNPAGLRIRGDLHVPPRALESIDGSGGINLASRGEAGAEWML